MKRNRPTTVNTATVQAYFHRRGRLMLSEHDGALWATDTYLLLRVPDEKHPIGRLLAEFNLPFEPMVCDVMGRTVRRTDAKPPGVTKLLPSSLAGWMTLEPFTIGGQEVRMEFDARPAALMRRGDGRKVILDVEKRTMVERLSGIGSWVAQGEVVRPAAFANEDRVLGLLVPIRSLISDAEDAELDRMAKAVA